MLRIILDSFSHEPRKGGPRALNARGAAPLLNRKDPV